ncbi:glycosyltransferase family 4 protein [Antribacter gilvus]|uniref:glycosyltransferase family 4 protein n=1 Tax=Antribacter gilvus TaxID=2304675 RepID=UPI000F779661|nr:glycosyltransferase family 4 protein [Antribacter gilvus]
MRQALVVALHDGFYSAATGAGLSNQALLAAVAEHLPDGTDLVVAPVHLDPTSPEHDPAAHQRTLAILGRVRHKVIPLSNGTGGQSRFGDLAAFQHLAKDSARVLEGLKRDYGSGAFVAIDRPFVGLGPHLSDAPLWNIVYLPRSSALHHADVEHTEWEARGLVGWLRAGATFGAISTHMRELLEGQAVPADRVLDVPNGLTGAVVPLSAAPPIPPEAENGFLLAFGRAAPYKGFDDLLDALDHLRSSGVPVPHLVLAAVTDDGGPSAYQRHLRRRCSDLAVTLWTRFDRGIPGLLGHPALVAVIVPSRVEPFGRIPLEAFIAGAGPVVATTVGGLTDTVIDGVTGYTAAPRSPIALADAIQRALNADPQTIALMGLEGRQLAADRDYTRTIGALVDYLLDRRPMTC